MTLATVTAITTFLAARPTARERLVLVAQLDYYRRMHAFISRYKISNVPFRT
jgi:hypothetical protein